jgi:lipopolysaccharide/colanic/teichoic acid biosynthesis glycosyltransferase
VRQIQSKYEIFGKRLFDIVCSFLGLAALSPILALVSLEPFNLIKFRSMIVVNDPEKCQFNPGDESRVTRIGFFLRKAKIDELPELLNVLKGEMSFVGPRPEVFKYREIYAGEFAPILSLRPGITDLASIKYRNEEELLRQSADPEKMYREVILPDKLKMCLTYKEIISFKTDVSIIIATLRRILWRHSNHSNVSTDSIL